MFSEKWIGRFLKLAREISSWSKDPSTKCGAVIVRPNKTIASLGYNGFPRSMRDDDRFYCDRDVKYSRILHAEDNALLSAVENLHSYALFIYPLPPCDRCAVRIIQSGIQYVFAPELLGSARERWQESVSRSQSYFDESGVHYQWVK